MLFTFPSRYLFTIGHQEYLALDCGQPRFPRGFSISSWYSRTSAGVLPLSSTGLSPSVVFRSRILRLEVGFVTPWKAWRPSSRVVQHLRDIGLQPTKSHRFGLFPFRSPLLREYFLFLGVLRCFTSPTYLSQAYVFSLEFPSFTREGFPIRVSLAKPVRRLTRAFRSLAAPFFGSWCLGILRGPLVA